MVVDDSSSIKSEIDFKKTSDYLNNIINTIADPIFVKDEEHTWILLNDSFCRFMGYSRDELIGKSDHDFFPKEEADVFWAKDEEVFKTGEENINQENFTDSYGDTHVIITKKTVYTSQEGEKYLVGVIRDVTETKKIESKLREKIEELERFQRLSVDRELKMVELKEKIKKLQKNK